MSTITAFESVTLDGVMQGPGRPDEDTRNGFTQGGWANGFQDEVSMKYAGEGMSAGGGLLFGHRTYTDVLGHWTSVGPNPFVDVLVGSDKFVASRSAHTKLPYENSELLAGDAVSTVAALKERYSSDLMIMGSGELVRQLHRAGLIDRFSLLIHPLVLGSGTRLFPEGVPAGLELTRSLVTSTGVIIAEYRVRPPRQPAHTQLPRLDQAIEQYHQALNAFVTGDPALQKKMFSTREDVSLANPLGPPQRGRAAVEGIMDRAAAVLRDGEPITFERISLYTGTDLAFMVELEWARAKVAGSTDLAPIPLRVTTVFRLEEGQWKVLHRHADTIVTPRPVQSIIQR